jgi:ADP-ribose pyrophosphatase YjhB (NUDIX family)
MADFREYRVKISTCGGILMNKEMTKVVLVQGFGGDWSFPRGKIKQDEQLTECGIRQVSGIPIF